MKTCARLFVMIFLLAIPKVSANEILLEIPGITGESTILNFTGKIVIFSTSFIVSNDSGASPYVSEINFTKIADSTSPLLFGKVVQGSNLGTVKIFYLRANQGVFQKYLEIIITNARLTSQSSSSDGQKPQETYTLLVDAMTINNFANPNGSISVNPVTTFTYDFNP